MKRTLTPFEMKSHDIQYRKRDKADFGQLGDNRLFEKTDWTIVGATLFVVGFGLATLAVIY